MKKSELIEIIKEELSKAELARIEKSLRIKVSKFAAPYRSKITDIDSIIDAYVEMKLQQRLNKNPQGLDYSDLADFFIEKLEARKSQKKSTKSKKAKEGDDLVAFVKKVIQGAPKRDMFDMSKSALEMKTLDYYFDHGIFNMQLFKGRGYVDVELQSGKKLRVNLP